METAQATVNVTVQEGLEFHSWRAFLQGFSAGVAYATQQAIDHRWKQFEDRRAWGDPAQDSSTGDPKP